MNPARRTVSALILILITVLTFNLPFINQAFHIDDALYLFVAKQVPKNPWFPQDVPIVFEGMVAQDMASQEHPPLLAYYIAEVAARVGKFSEPTLHAAFLIFPLLIGLSMYFLSTRFTRHPLLATLLLLLMPVVYIMSHTLMTDVPFLAFWLLSIGSFIYGIDRGRRFWIWVSGLMVGLSTLVSYTGLCLIPLLLAYAALRRALRAARPAIALPLLIVAAWLTLNYIHYHRFIWGWLLGYYFGKGQVLSFKLLVSKLGYLLAALGAVTVFPLSVLALAHGATKSRWYGLLFLAGLVLLSIIKRDYSVLQTLMLSLFLTAGIVFLAEIMTWPVDRSGRPDARASAADEHFLALWLFGALLYATLAYLTGAARYLLPLTPALAILFMRRAEARLEGAMFKVFMSATLALTGGLAVVLAAADYELAGVYRAFASELQEKYRPARGHIWFTGEWGLRAYLEGLGGEALGRYDARPRRGDLLVVPTLATPYPTRFSAVPPRRTLLMIAPSQVRFDLPALPEDARLVLRLAMPFWRMSDGMGLSIDLQSGEARETIFSLDLTPEIGRSWHSYTVPLSRGRDQRGTMIFTTSTGAHGDATGDWVGLASARIQSVRGSETITIYDFLAALPEAQVRARPGFDYHTEENKPVFMYDFSLEEDRLTALLESKSYYLRLPVRLMDANVPAGFWGAHWGLLPFSVTLARQPIETISVFRVINEVEGPGPAPLFWFE